MLLSFRSSLGLAPHIQLLLFIQSLTLAAGTAVTLPVSLQTGHRARDPSIIQYEDSYYVFQTSGGIEYYKASNLSEPWEFVGEVLNHKPSVIQKEGRNEPWAPTVIQYNGTFFCFYCVSEIDTRNSSIGVATSDTLEVGSWTDHGALVSTVSGENAGVYPYNVSNALDPSVIFDQNGSQALLSFGSYWTDLWQVPLTEDLLSVENAQQPNASHLAINVDFDAEEGSFISYNAPYYYLWFSRGYCCGLQLDDLPASGTEYSIRMGRSLDASGPYLDKNNVSLLDGGGSLVYGSNHDGQVYAPGSCGVLSRDNESDVLFYHYYNQSIGVSDEDAFLGYNYLTYEDGWPVVSSSQYNDSIFQEKGSSMSSDSHRLDPFNPAPIMILCTILWTLCLS